MAKEFDFTAVKPSATTFPRTAAEENPAEGWLTQSYESGQAFEAKVPASAVQKMINLLKYASRDLSIGLKVRILVDDDVYTVSKETTEYVKTLAPNKNVTIAYQGVEKTSRPRKVETEAEDSAAE